jgi:hypothetical protein
MIENLYKFKDEIQKEGIICCFTGPFTQELLIGIGETLKKKMQLEGESMSTTLDLFSVFVEETQNIIHHSAERVSRSLQTPEAKNLALGIIIVGQKDRSYYIQGGNYVENKQIKIIQQRLKILQQMNQDELETYYRKQRKKKLKSIKERPGLGLIEVARKVSQPIEFSFKKIDDSYSFFSFIATV